MCPEERQCSILKKMWKYNWIKKSFSIEIVSRDMTTSRDVIKLEKKV